MDEVERLTRAAAFDGAADDYDAVRPGYPTELIESLIGHSEIDREDEPPARVLEIGCGTGQATRPLATLGFTCTCLEPSRDLAAVARSRLADFSGVEVLNEPFEAFEASPGSFDLVVAATSFHWLDPGTRLDRIAGLLRPGGTVGILAHTHPRPFTGFFDRSQRVYAEVVPQWSRPGVQSADEAIMSVEDELRASPRFELLVTRHVDWWRDLTTAAYLRLLRTFSDHRGLPAATRDRLFAGLAALIDDEFEGVVTRPYRTWLWVARRIG